MLKTYRCDRGNKKNIIQDLDHWFSGRDAHALLLDHKGTPVITVNSERHIWNKENGDLDVGHDMQSVSILFDEDEYRLLFGASGDEFIYCKTVIDAILSSGNAVVFMKDKYFKYIFNNISWLTIYQFCYEDIVGRRHIEHVKVKNLFWEDVEWQVFKSGRMESYERDVSTFMNYHVKAKCVPIINENDNVLGTLTIAEIEEEKEHGQLMKELPLAGKYVQELLLDMGIQYFEFAYDGKMILAPDYLNHSNNSNDYSYVVDIMQSIHRDDQSSWLKVLSELFEAKVSGFQLNLRIHNDTEEYVWVRQIVRKAESFNKYVGVLIDINDLVKANSDALESEKFVAKFLNRMSYHYRVPMNSILGFGELLEKTPMNDKQKLYLSSVLTASRNLLRLMDDLLDYTKIEAGIMEITPQALSPKFLGEEIEKMMSVQAHAKGLTFDLSIAPSVPNYILGDSFRIFQILLNLCGNAVKFTDSGEVRLNIFRKGNQLAFAVEDTGIGMDQGQILGIFDSFVQGNKRTFSKYGGTGLGLSISKRLANLMEGDIDVESTPDKGSIFTLLLPLKEVEGESIKNIEHQKTDYTMESSGQRILVVDDQEANHLIISANLIPLGMQVDIAYDGYEALEYVENNSYNLILIDFHMPGMDGFQTIGKIREKFASDTLAIILMTADLQMINDKRIEYYDIQGVMPKPIDMGVLLQMIQSNMSSKCNIVSEDEIGKWAPLEEYLDVEDSLNRWENNKKLYSMLLLSFAESYRKGLEIVSDDKEDLLRIFHSLKGLAANIGANSIRKSASELEEIVHWRDVDYETLKKTSTFIKMENALMGLVQAIEHSEFSR